MKPYPLCSVIPISVVIDHILVLLRWFPMYCDMRKIIRCATQGTVGNDYDPP
jgi:hypothetical protein